MNFNSDVKHQGAKRFLAMVVSPNVKTAKSSPGFRLIIHLNAKWNQGINAISHTVETVNADLPSQLCPDTELP